MTQCKLRPFPSDYIHPRWGEAAIASVRAMAVEDWLMTLAPKTRGHIRSPMSTLFKCAQCWELVETNPMQLVRVKNLSKRLERPSVLTAEEFHKLLPHIREPYRIRFVIAGCLGLRARAMTDSNRQAPNNVVQMVLKKESRETAACSGGKPGTSA